jgi:translocation-and-assembly-module (TAM) inner membrane subunit TamB-like protein
MTAKNILKKTGKIVAYILGFVLLILIAVIIFLNTNYAKQLIRNKLQSYLQNKIKTKVEIGSIDYHFPQSVAINDLYIEDQQKDTLLYGGKLLVDIAMLKLIWGETDIQKVELTNIKANISRSENNPNYNFQYIIDAFASKTSTKKDTSSIILKELVLNGFSLNYKDEYGGNDFYTAIRSLDITINQFQPSSLLFAIDQFKTDSVYFSMQSYKTKHSAKSVAANADKTDLRISLQQLDMTNINASVKDNNTGMQYSNQLNHLSINNAGINLASQKLSLDKIMLDSSSVKFVSPLPEKEEAAAYQGSSPGWVVSLKSLQFNNDQFQFDNNQAYRQTAGFDPSHIKAQNIMVNAGNINYSPDSMAAIINQFAFKEKSGLILEKMNAHILYSNKGISLTSLYLRTPYSLVQNSLQLHYNSVKDLTGNPKNASVSATLLQSTIAVNDLYTIMPSVKKFMPVDKFKNNVVVINTEINGNLSQLKIPYLQLHGLSGSSINAKAILYNVTDSKKLSYNITVYNSHILRNDLLKFIPSNDTVTGLPADLSLNMRAKGDMNNITPDLTISSSDGTISAKGYIYNFKNTEAATYDMQLTAKDIEAGKLLKQDNSFGKASFTASAKGTGFNYKTMHSSFNILVQHAAIKNYDYNNITVAAELNNGKMVSNGNMDDPNLQFHYTVTGDLSGKYPSAVEANLILDTIQLQKLHLYKDTLNASFSAYAKAANLDPANLNLYARIDSTQLNVKNKPYLLDSITATITGDDRKKDIAFQSPLIDVFIKGEFDYDNISRSLLQYIDKYYNVVSTPAQNLPPQEIAINGVIKDHPLITGLIGGLTYEDIHFNGSFSSQGGDSALNWHTSIPKLKYQSYKVDNGKIDITSLNNEITYAFTFDQLHINKNIFYTTSIKGDVINDSLNVVALTKDERKKDRYGMSAAFTANNKNYTISLKDNLLINYQKWDVSPDNKISYSPQGILIKDFWVQNQNAKIAANSQGNVNSPIDINIANFDIKDITSITNSDTLMASGIMNGKINISGFDRKVPAFTGDLTIDQFKFKQQPVGNLTITAKNQDENTITANIGLTGDDNDLTAKGTYNLDNDQNQFDIDLDIKKLKMATLQAFTADNISRSSGSINGDVKLSGNFSEPKWNGAINFDSAKFTLATTGTSYAIDKQNIALSYPSIKFNNFAIKDSIGNTMTIDGAITANSISDYDLSLAVKSKNFILVNTPQAINNEIYGHAAVNTDLTISGNTTSPDIEGDVFINDKSDVTIVLPEQNIDKDASLSVVRFIDRDTFPLPEKVGFSPVIEPKTGFAQFLNYNLNIKINKTAALTIIIDPSGGDELKVQGDAELNAGVDPGGHIVLAGTYALTGGYYTLNAQFLSRKFNLLDGSTITFAGAPMDAKVDITAEYIANAPASDLLENEEGGMDTKTANSFNQKIPFRVLLYLKGEMKKPTITFDVQLPDENSNVPISEDMRTIIENKLIEMRSDVAVTNKEVFSLLLLGHFVGEESSDFFKGNGTSNDEMARESVSKFLSSALNQISSDLFKGIDVDLNLNSYQDYSTGDEQDKTDLNVAISKNFLDNRLTVTAGKNFGVEGQDAAATAVQENSSSFPDLTANYKLSKDGRYIAKAYKQDQFEEMVDGYITETGVGFVVTFNYNKFKELFDKKKQEEKKSPK